MLEFLIATNIIAGKVETGPAVFEWDFIAPGTTTLIHVIESKDGVQMKNVQ